MKIRYAILCACVAAVGQAGAAESSYGINFASDATIPTTHNPVRYLNSIQLTSADDGVQMVESSQQTDHLLYHDCSNRYFKAAVGEKVTVSFNWSGNWMHGYVYLDRGNDGSFDADDVMSYSYHAGKNSTGATTSNANPGVNPPAFTIPADLEPGVYRMRFKVDWDNIDPAGAPAGNDGGDIITNAGAITDVSIYLHNPGENFTQGAYSGPDGNYDSPVSGTKEPDSGITSITVNGVTLPVASTSRYCALRDTAVPVVQGEPLTVTANYSGSATPLRLYFDYGHDGIFAEADANFPDLLGTLEGEPSFTLHPAAPNGVYRARIVADGDCVVDFLVNLHSPAGRLDVKAMNGNVLNAEGSTLPLTATFGTALTVQPVSVLPGYTAKELIVRHGHNLDGPAYVLGNRQWQDTSMPLAATMTIPAELIDGDVDLYVIYEEDTDSEWTKIWGDEFNGSEIDHKRWKFQSRQGATWNRLVAQGDEETARVNVIADGRYKSYCIPTPDEFKSFETQDMISGALNSQGLFHFHYGRVEARIKTTRHTGNFPAFWMMPMDQSRGWPKDGEIDIWEEIDDQQRSHHTVHSGWTYKSYGDVSRNTPASTNNVWTDHDLWHVYALEWDAEQLRWYVDGKQVFAYTNQHFSEGEYTEEVTWPFGKDFYVIINQSVGNGSWAQWCDTSFTYLTEFDWVRAYKKKTDDASTWTTSIEGNGDDPEFYTPGEEDTWTAITDVYTTPDESAAGNARTEYFDLRGCRIARPATAGVYLMRRGNTVTKILKH